MTEEKLGATGEFPEGKLDETDEGELRLVVGGYKDGTVAINFGKPIAWLGMKPQQAADFATAILKCAREVAKENGVTITITL